MACARALCVGFVFFLVLYLKVCCYEKTLRKIVRNQAKMVQRPFSDNSKLFWKNFSHPRGSKHNDDLMFPGHIPMKSIIHKIHSKTSTILSSLEKESSKSTYHKNTPSSDLRLIRNTQTHMPARHFHGSFFPDRVSTIKGENASEDATVGTYYHVAEINSYSDNLDLALRLKDDVVTPSNTEISKDNVKKIVNNMLVTYSEPIMNLPEQDETDIQDENGQDIDKIKTGYIVQEISTGPSIYNDNLALTSLTCAVVHENKVDIDAQTRFLDLDIEAPWVSQKRYWNNMFDSRYDFLMRNPKWPPLKVILIPRSHVDTMWKRPFDRYQTDTAKNILSNAVKKLRFYNNLTFTWNEIAHMNDWWKTSALKSRSTFRRLLKSGRIEITTGGWVETDQATTHLFGLVHLLIEGHQWLKRRLNYSPKVAWLTNSVTHSPTMTYLLSSCGITNLIITNLHYAWEHNLAEYQNSDFVWVQNWDNDKTTPTKLDESLKKMGNDRIPKHSVLTHYLQFNSAGFKACGPNPDICINDYDFAKALKNFDINTFNIKDKAEILLEQYSKTGTLSPHNVIIAPIGGPRRYELQTEFDYQYNNYQKIADFVNINSEIYKATMVFGTPKDYFDSITEKHQNYATLKGDFLSFADINTGTPAYWAGFFTSRPLLKILLRRLQSTLRTTEILFTFALNMNAFREYNSTELFHLLIRSRQNFALLLDRNVVTGTLSSHALKHVHKLILTTVKDCWYIQEVTASLISIKPGETRPYLQKYVYRDGEFVSTFKTVSPGDQVYIFNSMGNERTETVELVTRHPHIRVVDHNNKDITIQINPVWKYSSDNIIKISARFFKIIFVIEVPPMTLELFKIKETYDGSNNAATLYCLQCIIDTATDHNPILTFNIKPIEVGDIILESYKHRLILDEGTGFLKSVTEKRTNEEKMLILDYGAFRSSDKNAGIYLFNTNTTKPLEDILMPFKTGSKTKIIIIIAGHITTEMTSIFGNLLQHTVKLFNLFHGPLSKAIYVESKVDYENSPKNRELELFLAITTDINNGINPELYIDNNGFQYTKHILNISRRVESNMYPITSMAYMQDHRSRLSFITDHAQGITALQEGQIVAMLDRRILFNDGRGTHEGLADSSITCHRHFILLESFLESNNFYNTFATEDDIKLPSTTALYLANSLNYFLDMFFINKEHNNLTYYAILPLIKTPFPCDVTVLNYRVTINKNTLRNQAANSALMILHRQVASCQLENTLLYCKTDNSFSIDQILRNIKAVYRTNLVGTSDGVPLNTCNRANFPPMELLTLRIHF